MKNVIAKAAMLVACLFVSAAARADCTTDPFRMGWDAAKQACEDIAQDYVPGPYFIEAPERTCTTSDVIKCKNAMAQYLRGSEGKECANLIRKDVPLTDPATGSVSGTAQQLWRAYVTTTCNL